MKRRLTIPVVLFALSLATISICARADTIVWVNTNGGNWSDTSNWNPNQVPGFSDTAIITNSGNYTVTLDVDANVNGLVLGSGDSTTQTFLLNGQSFTLAGQGTVNSNGVVDLNSGTLTFSGTILANYGTVVWNNADIGGQFGPQIYNYGLWDAQTNRTFNGNGTVFNNYGTFLKSAGGGSTIMDASMEFINSGTVDVQSGMVALHRTNPTISGGDGAIFNTDSGAVINFLGYFLQGKTTFTGSGMIQGNLDGISAANAAVLDGTITFSAIFLSQPGPLTIGSNCTVNLVGTIGMNSFSGLLLLTNYGTVNWISGNLAGDNFPVIDNYGLWDAQTNNTFSGGSGTVFYNYGTFRKSGGAFVGPGTDWTQLDGNTTFNNSGVVDVQIGLLAIDHGTGSGTFNTVGNGSFETDGQFYFGSYILTGNPVFTGTGRIAGHLTGNNAVLHGTLNLDSGTVFGTLTAASNCVFTLVGDVGSLNFSGVVFTNYGTVVWSNANLYCSSSPQIYNYGLWNATGNNTFYGAYNSGGTTTFNNFGTFRKSGDGYPYNYTLFDSSAVFNNAGTVDVQNAELILSHGVGSGVFNTLTNGSPATDPKIYFGGYILTGNPAFSGEVGGTLIGSNAVVNGWMMFVAGSLQGALTVASNATINLDGPGPLSFVGTHLTNYGTVISGGTDLSFSSSPQIYNYGLWDARGNNTFDGGGTTTFNNYGLWDIGANGINLSGITFNNYGIFRKSGGSFSDSPGFSWLDNNTTFNDFGTVDIQIGGLEIATGSGGGVFNTATNASLVFYAYTLAGSSTFSGTGLVVGGVTGSNAVFNGSLTFSGSLSGTLTVASNAVMSLAGNYGTPNFSGTVLTNYGTVNWGSTDLNGASSPRIYNYGLWDAIGNNTFYGAYNSDGTTTFNNYGTFRKSTNALPLAHLTWFDNNTTFNNHGMADVLAGSLVLDGNRTLSGGTLNFGINSSNDFGSIYLSGAAALDGKLIVNFNNGYSPTVSNSFLLVYYGSKTGTFTSLNLPTLPSPLSWHSHYGSYTFALSVVAPAGTFIVTDTNDTLQTTSLRGAIIAANQTGGTNLIVLNENPDPYRLTIPGVDGTAQTGDLNISGGNLTIVGAGSHVTIDATGLGDRVFRVSSNAMLTLRNLVIQGGSSPTGSGFADGEPGGAILNAGTLSLDHCIITNNSSGPGQGFEGDRPGSSGGDGGGIYNKGALRANNCAIVGNTCGNGVAAATGGNGGGIRNDGFCFLARCTIVGNQAGAGGGPELLAGISGSGGNGGAIFNVGTMHLTACIVGTNAAGLGTDGGAPGFVLLTSPGGAGGNGGNGGGIYNVGRMEIDFSTVCGNNAGNGGNGATLGSGGDAGVGGNGGGIFNIGNLNLIASTISDNYCGNGASGGDAYFGSGAVGGTGGSGGGIYNAGLNSLTACTIALNTSGSGGNGGSDSDLNTALGGNGGDGGGVWNEADGTVETRDSIIALNLVNIGGVGGTNGADGLGFDVAGDFISYGFNLVGTADYSLGFTNGLRADKIGSNANPIDPLLGPLQMNGGFTPTHALLWGSPAIDQGNCGRIRVDQRGHRRPYRYVSILRPVRGDGSDIGAFELDTPQGP